MSFLADPQAFLPGNRMTFSGIPDAQARADVIAYLKDTTERAAGGGAGGGMTGGMMAAPELADLKSIGPEGQVAAIRYCGDTYEVTTVAGQTIRSGNSTFDSRRIRARRGRRRDGLLCSRPA